MLRKTLAGLIACLIPALSLAEGAPPPVIDMHLHAIPIDFHGPPPQTICAPYLTFPAWDPKNSYSGTFGKYGDKAGCGKPIVSPMTDDEVMQDTLEALDRFNIFAVTSGPMQRVEKWRQASPRRIIPGLVFQLDENTPDAETFRSWHDQGKLRV
ncbi:MAG: hypothetical protein JJ992_01650, partial [Planctomycetes bacterium]|nr:hypothetical protein [Planctomycetota bacterium]